MKLRIRTRAKWYSPYKYSKIISYRIRAIVRQNEIPELIKILEKLK